MEQEQIDELNREFYNKSEDIRAGIAQASSGLPWLSWFPVKEWEYGTGLQSKVEGEVPTQHGRVGSRTVTKTYELKRLTVRSNPISVEDHDTSEPEWQIGKFRDRALYEWERFIRSAYLGQARIGGPDPFAPKYDLHPVAVSRPITADVLNRAVLHLKSVGATPFHEHDFGLVSDISIPAVDGLTVVTDSRPRRWKRAAQGLEEVQPYLPYLPEEKCDLIPNPEYEDAIIQDYPILVKGSMELLVPKPLSDTRFDTSLWTGRVHWMNIRDQHTNPFGKVGKYISALEAAARPLKLETSYVIRALRP